MRAKWSVPVLVAMTVGLVGCDMLPTGGDFDALVGKLSTSQRTAANAMIQDAIATLNVDSQLNMASAYTDDGSLRTQSLSIQAATGSTTVSDKRKEAALKELQRRQAMAARMKARLQAAKAKVKDFQAPTLKTNADGTKTESAALKVDHKNGAQQITQEKIFDAEGNLTEVRSHFERTHKNGLTYKADRVRVLQEDGSWKVTFTSTITGPQGKTKTVAWTRTINADGSEVGDGTITRFDGSVVTIHVERSADGVVTTRTVDSRAKVSVNVEAGDDSEGATVKVTNDETQQVAGTQTVSDAAAVDPAAQ